MKGTYVFTVLFFFFTLISLFGAAVCFGKSNILSVGYLFMAVGSAYFTYDTFAFRKKIKGITNGN